MPLLEVFVINISYEQESRVFCACSATELLRTTLDILQIQI